MTKRVAVIAYHSSPLLEPGSGDAGGMTVYVRQLAAALAERDCYTDIYTRASSPEDRMVTISPGVRVIPVAAGPRSIVSKEELPRHIDEFVASIKANATVQRIAYDVIHSHYWQSGIAAKRLVDTWKVPFVHSPHTLARVKNSNLAPDDVPEPGTRIAGEESIIASADVLIASADDEYQALACMYKAPHDSLKVLSPGVDHSVFFPGDKAAARRAMDLPAERPILLFAGRIQRLKGVDLAIRSLAELAASRTDRPLLVVVGGASGPGGETELHRLKSIAQELGVSRDVIFKGPMPHAQLAEMYRAADVTLVCSYSESFGLAALEAHASGCPVVGTPVGGLSHIVSDGRSGILIGNHDPAVFAPAVAKVIDARHDGSFSSAAYEESLRFSWQNTADSFLQLYECLIEEKFPELCTC